MILEIISIILLSLGCVMMFSGVLGLYRFPDIYMRLQSTTKVSTGGAITILIGMILKCGISALTGRIFIIMMLIIVLTPIISHAIARSAHLQKIVPTGMEEK